MWSAVHGDGMVDGVVGDGVEQAEAAEQGSDRMRVMKRECEKRTSEREQYKRTMEKWQYKRKQYKRTSAIEKVERFKSLW